MKQNKDLFYFSALGLFCAPFMIHDVLFGKHLRWQTYKRSKIGSILEFKIYIHLLARVYNFKRTLAHK